MVDTAGTKMIPERIVLKAKALYGQNYRFYGPYTRKQDSRKIVILYDGTKRSAKLLAKFKLELYLNRKLRAWEQVDHRDEDRLNDRIENLRVLTGVANRKKSVAFTYGKGYKVYCQHCKLLIATRYSAKPRRKFCSNRCRGLHLGNQYQQKAG